MSKNFFLVGLPRSRTAWFSALFTTGCTVCHHDYFTYNPGNILLDDEFIGTASPNPMHGVTYKDGSAIVKIERPIEEVYESSLAFIEPQGDEFNNMYWAALKIAQRALQELPGPMYNYYEIDDYIEEIWDHLMPIPFQRDRYEIYKNLNIQSTDTGV